MKQFYCQTVDRKKLTPEAIKLVEKEINAPIEEKDRRSLRIKVTDLCGHACTFCHNEGTKSTGRCSIFLKGNKGFYADDIHPDKEFLEVIKWFKDCYSITEAHLTGGEPTLLKGLPLLVDKIADSGLTVKMTTNGETGGKIYKKLKRLASVNFSVLGTKPEEILACQRAGFDRKWAEDKIRLQEEAVKSCLENGIRAKINVVMCDGADKQKVLAVIKNANGCSIRLLNKLGDNGESIVAVYNLLASIGAKPIKMKLNRYSSSCQVEYDTDYGLIGFKQIRYFRLPSICNDCPLSKQGCEEGYYGPRLYKNKSNGKYLVGLCLQRMDKATFEFSEFSQKELK